MKKNFNISNIYGINSLSAALDLYPQNIFDIHICQDIENIRIKEIINKIKDLGINYTSSPKELIFKLSKNKKHQGIFAKIKLINIGGFSDLKDYLVKNNMDVDTILILDSVQDPQNLGSCIRTAAAAGVRIIVLNKNSSAPINEHVINSSVGALFNTKIFYVSNLINSINLIKEFDYWIYGLDGLAENSIFLTKFTKKTALIMGSEGTGMRKLTKQKCDVLINIPMVSSIESLNVSVSSGIALFEINRQRI